MILALWPFGASAKDSGKDAERILRERVRGGADAARDRGEVPVERIARERDRRSVHRIHEPQRKGRRAGDAEDGEAGFTDGRGDGGDGVGQNQGGYRLKVESCR